MQGDKVFDPSVPTWIHDVAVGPGGPVIVFASLHSPTDHRYHYAHWDGSDWIVEDITPAGGTFREDGGSPYYSGGLTLDHEDPSRVYLSRQVGAGLWRIEMWDTADEGANWTPTIISVDEGKNVRPVSPRGMPSAFDDDLRVIWMRGAYPSYETYQTSITATWGGDNQAPVADAELSARSGPAPLPVTFESTSEDPDPAPVGGITAWNWDFGDGTTGSGPQVDDHVYEEPGRYFPTLTVVDTGGASSTFVEEVVVGLPAAPVTYTGGTDGSTAHGAIDPENDATEWYFEYGPTIDFGYRTVSAHARRRRFAAADLRRATGSRRGPALPLPARGGQRHRQHRGRGPRDGRRRRARLGRVSRRRAGDRRASPPTGASASCPGARPATRSGATPRPSPGGSPWGRWACSVRSATRPRPSTGSAARSRRPARRSATAARWRDGSAGIPATS